MQIRVRPAAASGTKHVASPLALGHPPAGQQGNIASTLSQSDRVRQTNLPGFQAKLATPFGLVGVRTEGAALAEIVYLPRSAGTLAPTNALAERTCAQIERYVADPGFRFKLPMKELGTAFQRRVWNMIASIPCGETRTYGDIARALRNGPRAVGQACGTNYFPLVIPCHRVVAASGLGGFGHHSGGYLLEVKRWLLRHEKRGDKDA